MSDSELTEQIPMPWYLEQDNDSGICVKDSTGETIYYEDYGSIPDEAKSSLRDKIIRRARTFAYWLIDFSERRTKHMS